MHKKYFIRVLLFFYFFSSFLSATHIHHDELESHADCKVCIVVKDLHSADFPAFHTVTIELPDYLSISEANDSNYISEITKGYNAHAPPLFL